VAKKKLCDSATLREIKTTQNNCAVQNNLCTIKKQKQMKTQINGTDIIELGFPEGKTIGIALKINSKRHGLKRDEMIANFKNVLETPENYIDDAIFSKLAIALIEKANEKPEDFIALNQNPNA
jgi:tRNA-splicing ligase RtcB